MSATEQSELLAFAYRFDENIRRNFGWKLGEQTLTAIRENRFKQRATNDKKTCISSIRHSVLM
ncbi:hypothetical protein ACT7DH_06020 [Bacillus pacificus]